jgi:hypothetical protein
MRRHRGMYLPIEARISGISNGFLAAMVVISDEGRSRR